MFRAGISAFTLACLCAVAADSATLFDPALRFRLISTDHFVVYFHQGEDRTAARLAVIAEDTWRSLRTALGVTPPGLTHVVLVDQTEIANGWATPVPYDTVMIAAVWPAGSDFIGNTDDWLRLAFTHEFTHIVHLDRSEAWAGPVRRVFGRIPLAFPNLFLPTWQIEGIATYEEGAITGGGRPHAGDFGAIVSEGARARQLEPLDRANGGLTDWPGPFTPYAYGAGFHTYLADRYGTDRFGPLAERTAGMFPFTASRAFRQVYGESLGALWVEYLGAQGSQEAPGSGLPTPVETRSAPLQVTHHGFTVLGPRFDRFTCPGCPARIVYSIQTPDAFPSLNQVALDGTGALALTTRYLGSTTAIGRGVIYFDQQETRRNAGVYSDIYALARASGRVTRITSEARILDPDLSPDESTLVAVRDAPGRRDLVLVRLPAPGFKGKQDATGTSRTARIETLVSEPETQFDVPRWSPDGRSIAVERHRLDGWSEIVLVDAATRAIRVVASVDRTRIVTPAWHPDGRAIVAAVAREDDVFNLFEFDVDGTNVARQLTRTTGGATWPDVAPDGGTIVFVGYAASGFDVFQIPYPPPAARTDITNAATRKATVEPTVDGGPARRGEPNADATASPAARYAPWTTLAPTWWSPVIEGDQDQLRIGATTAGADVLGYHAYSLSATWLVSQTARAPSPNSAAPDWQATYAYGRWRPIWWLSASSATSFQAGPPTEEGLPSTSTLREREFAAGVVFPVNHVRVSHAAAASIVRGIDDFTMPGGDTSRRRTALRGAWSTRSAHTYGFSVSPEGGVALGATGEVVRQAFGSDADATAFTGDARLYLPAFAPHHVMAVRLAGGVSSGDPTLTRTFLLGGPSPNASVVDFGHDAISLLRGFSSNTFAGNRVALLNLDYRFPLVRPERGLGTWPAFLHTLHAAAFVDAGHAWTHAFSARDLKTSAGGELSADIVAGYAYRLTVTAGAAWGHDGSGTIADRTTVYARVGRAF